MGLSSAGLCSTLQRASQLDGDCCKKKRVSPKRMKRARDSAPINLAHLCRLHQPTLSLAADPWRRHPMPISAVYVLTDVSLTWLRSILNVYGKALLDRRMALCSARASRAQTGVLSVLHHRLPICCFLHTQVRSPTLCRV